MRVKWLSHPHTPEKNNTTEHVSRELAAVAIGYGQAVAAPYKNYVERLSEEFREGRDSSNVNPPQVTGIVWKCGALGTSGRPVIYRKQGGEVARIEDEQQAVQYGCPESILKQFRALLAEKNGGFNVVEAAQQKQAAQEAAEKTGVWKQIFSRA